MSWVMVAVAGGTALMSVSEGQQKREAQRQQNLAEAEKSRYSYLTGMEGNTQAVSGSEGSDALKGGLAGFSMAQGMGGGSAAGAAPAAVGAKSMGPVADGSQYGNYLDGQSGFGTPAQPIKKRSFWNT